MSNDHDSDSANSSQKMRRRRLRRAAGGGAALLILLLLGIFGLLERIAHRPSPVRMTLTAAEIEAESAHLKQAGLIVSDGIFLKEHPFESPWTSHSLLVPSSWSAQPFLLKSLLGPRSVRADLLLADLDVLEPVMERAYGGWDSAAARGWNWNQWFSDWRKKLAQKGSAEISFDEAFAPIDALIAFQRDNHTQIPLSRQTTMAGSQTALLSAAPSAPCTEIRAGNRFFSIAADDAGQQVRSAKLWRSGVKNLADTNYLSMPTSYRTPQAVNCGGVWIRLQQVGNSGGLFFMLHWLEQLVKPDRPRIERIGEGIVYTRLPSFNSSNYEHLSRAGWAKRQPGDRVLIVDLRDNGGGDGQYGLDMLKDWIDERRMVPFEDIGSQLTSSCLYEPLRWNEAVQSTSRIFPDQKPSLQKMLNGMAQPYPPGCPRTEDIKTPKWTYLQHRFEPKAGDLRIIALVNSGCGSDCEWITAELASLPETIVMGANTFGIGQFIQPGYSVLPHTGLRYRIALGRSNLYGDNRSVDGYGLNVDVVIPEVNTLKPEQLREISEIVAKL